MIDETIFEKKSGCIIFHLRPIRAVSIAELRSINTLEDSDDIDTSLLFYLENMDDSIYENSFNLERYEDVKYLSFSYYQLSIGYSFVSAWESEIYLKKNEDFFYYILLETEDVVREYNSIQNFLRIKNKNVNLIKKEDVSKFLKQGNAYEIIQDGVVV